MTKPQLIKIIDERIENMATKSVYYPRRLKPKWKSLSKQTEKLDLFESYLKNSTSSIGFIRLMNVKLPSKTLESIIFDYPDAINLLKDKSIINNCIQKFKRYSCGEDYIKMKDIKLMK